MRTETALLAALVVLLSAVAVPVGATTEQETTAGETAVQIESTGVTEATNTTAENHPPDPSSDVLGWESVDGNGIWYNETIAVDNSDGINKTELDLLVARTMARDERIRQLEFESTVPVDIRSQEAYERNVTQQYANTSKRNRIHQNIKYEATFMVSETNDTVTQQSNNRAASTLGYYSPSENAIVIISGNESVLQIDEFTLAHELVHALQDQHFNLSKYDRTTVDENNAISGIVEGDAHYTQKLYEQRCGTGGAWNGTCIRSTRSSRGSSGQTDINIGMYLISYQPYSDGPPFVHGIHQRGGWSAVNDVYQNPPASSEQTIHPERYLADQPTNLTFEDRSNDAWTILDLKNGSVDYATFGEAGLFSMFWYPSYRIRGNAVIPYIELLRKSGTFDTYNYNHSITSGWDGDELYPYVPTSGPINYTEAGYVWQISWDSPSDAREFVDGYEQLLTFYDAQPVEGYRNTYRIPEDKEFGDAFYVNQSGATVTIVNGPSVESLSKIRAGAAPEVDAPPASIDVRKQVSDGTVTVRNVTLPEGGYVVIHNASTGTVLGHSTYLDPGTHTGVDVTLTETLPSGSAEIIAMAHRDTNGNQRYDFPDADGPYTVNGSPVTDSASVVRSTPRTATPTDTPTTTLGSEPIGNQTETDDSAPTSETTDGDTGGGSGPGFGAVAALVALVAAALVAARRHE